jgi:dTMP kinase
MAKYIVLEGPNGVGKTYQAKRLYEEFKRRNIPVEFVFEPGGSEIAVAIRELVQGTRFNEEMDPLVEAYLYTAARIQLLRVKIKPLLDDGINVISDRNFVTSLVYQGLYRGLV